MTYTRVFNNTMTYELYEVVSNAISSCTTAFIYSVIVNTVRTERTRHNPKGRCNSLLTRTRLYEGGAKNRLILSDKGRNLVEKDLSRSKAFAPIIFSLRLRVHLMQGISQMIG